MQAADDNGASFVELLVGFAIISVLATLAVPATAYSIDASRAREGAGFLAARLRMARQHAAFRTAANGLVFDQVNGRWQVRACEDSNGNGLRRAEVASGVDRCSAGPFELSQMFPGVSIATDGSLPGPDGEPGSADPVRFGSSDIASFSPEGSGTAGTVYVRSAKGQHYAVRVGNITGRIRILRFDRHVNAWR
jgi:type II secretory pathway pseudopilin PulG